MPETDKGKGDGKAKLSNPQIYGRNKDSGKLEVKDGVNDDDIELLKEEGLVGENFNLDLGYFSPAFMEKRLEILREKYRDLTAELPIVYADCDDKKALKVSNKAGLTILRGTGTHTKLFVTRPGGANGKTEIYIMDSNTNSYDKLIEEAYGDTTKYTIIYPDTEVSRQNRELHRQLEEPKRRASAALKRVFNEETWKAFSEIDAKLGASPRNSLGIQKDIHHCASYAVHFADRLYKKIKEVKEQSIPARGTVDCFNEVMADIGKGTYSAKVEMTDMNEGKNMVNRKMFSMPKEFWIYSGSEGALDRMITAEAKKQLEGENKKRGDDNAVLTEKEIEGKVKEIETNMKRKLVPYKGKRDEKEATISLTTGNPVSAGVKNEIRAEYAIVHNWRMKELKSVADRLRKAKEAQKIAKQTPAEVVKKTMDEPEQKKKWYRRLVDSLARLMTSLLSKLGFVARSGQRLESAKLGAATVAVDNTLNPEQGRGK
ncbi:MAG: hypothetical protein LBU15_02765 [Rickettsiales bacterium]|jgi:hypothetical protein|nr:hypothetical protein [Rickettsiales bacterium]